MILKHLRDPNSDFEGLAARFKCHGLPLNSKSIVGNLVLIANACMTSMGNVGSNSVDLAGMYVLYTSRENVEMYRNICASDLWAICASMLDM